MAAIVESLVFWNPDLGELESEATPYLFDNIGDTPNVKLNIRYQDYVTATTTEADNEDGLVAIIGFPDAATTGGVIPDKRLLWTSDPTGFETVKEGDNYTVFRPTDGSFSSNIVLEKISSELLLMETPYGLTSETPFPVDSVGYVTTPIQAVEFLDNLVENNSPVNYEDLTTGVTRRATVDGLDNTVTTPTAMKQLGDKSYQYGTLSVEGNNQGDGSTPPDVSQAFIITRKLLIAPLYTVDQVSNDVNGVAPNYLLNANSLKYIFRAELSKDLSNPNDIKTVVEDETFGNVGWENETPNTGQTDYFISNVVYTRLSGDIIDSLELSSNEMTVEFDVNNTTSSPISSSNTKIIVNHIAKPLSEGDYRLEQFPTGPNTARNNPLKENFLFDKAVTTVGGAAVDGENLGGVDQVIKSAISTRTDDNTAHVVVTIQLSAEALQELLDSQEFKIWVSTADYRLTRAKSDKVNLPVDKNTYFTEASDPTMITMVNSFRDHPMTSADAVKETLVIEPQDDYVCNTIFALDRNDIPNFPRADAEIDILSVKMQLIARKGSQFFILDQYAPDSIATDIIIDPTYGTVPRVNETQDRGFASPVDDLRRNITVKRRTDLDSGGIFYYEMSFPVIQRWEAWESLPAANNEFIDDGAAANEHEGKNHDWYHYFNGTGWNMFYRAEVTATKDGVLQVYNSQESLLSTQDYTDGIEWDSELITTFRTGGIGDEIGGNGLMPSENTLIRGEMDYVNPDVPALSNLTMTIRINEFEQTNYKGMFQISTKYDIESDNALIGLSSGLTATKTNPSGTTFRVEAENNYLNNAPTTPPRYSFRIYDDRADSGIPDGLATETGVLIDTENGIPLYEE